MPREIEVVRLKLSDQPMQKEKVKITEIAPDIHDIKIIIEGMCGYNSAMVRYQRIPLLLKLSLPIS